MKITLISLSHCKVNSVMYVVSKWKKPSVVEYDELVHFGDPQENPEARAREKNNRVSDFNILLPETISINLN